MAEATDYLKTCPSPGCKANIVRHNLQNAGDDLLLTLSCSEGHTTTLRYKLAETVHQKTAPKSVRTKVTGVTFKNPDGVDRQALLKHIQPEDELFIAKGQLDGKQVFYVRHAIGVIGMVKTDTIRALWADDATAPSELTAKVTQITGGQGEKTTLGCNIEVFGPKPTVFMDPDGKSIYHTNRNCCGMQDAREVTLDEAVGALGARPCKKCGLA